MGEETSENIDILTLQSYFTEIRKQFSHITEGRFKQRNKETLKCLQKFQTELNNFELTLHPIRNTNDFSNEKKTMLEDCIKKHLLLLQVLSYKADCPISKTVDEI